MRFHRSFDFAVFTNSNAHRVTFRVYRAEYVGRRWFQVVKSRGDFDNFISGQTNVSEES